MPWVHFHLTSKGQVNACCVSTIKYGNINNGSIEKIWNGDEIKAVRNKFTEGKFDEGCKVCINREIAGAKSLRQETFEKFPKIDIDRIQLPIYFDIRFSNVCNFRCRTCWHGASSKWYNDSVLLKTNVSQQAIIKNIKDFKSFILKNGKALKNAKEIYFAGGEPLVIEEHYLLLRYLIENKITNVKLRYNTNLSILKFKNYDVIELWQHFSEVEILASIDESNQIGEYIRKELNWMQFVENVKILNKIHHISLKISPTVSVFNIATLTEFYKHCLELKLIQSTDIYLNILERPYCFNSKILNSTRKEEITTIFNEFFEWCLLNNIPESVSRQFRDSVDFMNFENLHDKYWSVFIRITKKVDHIRNENFNQVFNID